MEKITIYKGIRSTPNMYHRQTAEGRRWGDPQVHRGHKGHQHRIHQGFKFLGQRKFQTNEPYFLQKLDNFSLHKGMWLIHKKLAKKGGPCIPGRSNISDLRDMKKRMQRLEGSRGSFKD